MKKLLSAILASLIVVPSVFGVNQTRKWEVDSVDVNSFKKNSHNDCRNAVQKKL